MSELKAINAHGVRKDDGSYYDRSQVDKYIDELDERHTTEITALEVSYRLQLDGLRYDKDAEIRRLKRALWLARAERAHSIILLWNVYCYQNNSLYFRDFINEKCNPFRNLPKKTAMEWSDLWETIEIKCRAKAKEYK